MNGLWEAIDSRTSEITTSSISLWSGEVVRCLQETLGKVSWERIYPIRTELVCPYNDDALNDLRRCVVLIIEVPRGAVELYEACAAASQCRTVLGIFKIPDAEVEVREINRQPDAMDVDLYNHIDKQNRALQDFPLSHLQISNETFLPTLSHIGTLLTVWLLQSDARTELQNAERTFRQLNLEVDKHSIDFSSYPEPTEDEFSSGKLRRAIPFVTEINVALSREHIEEAHGRLIGHIAMMPPYEVSQKGFLRDWALICLNEAKFNDSRGV
ncbi:hypothetical protein GGR50DRAFT_701745 [Xylaria sp. CBS 124048]|nr:hypothetical protein GGR50DRAFT_701745 [Xylaria sp. CBS 124048]